MPCWKLSHLVTIPMLIITTCSKVVHIAPTHNTCTAHTWYTAHPHSLHINLYLPPTDYTCRYQRDVFGTGCWKTLKCRKRSNANTTYYTDQGIFCGKLILQCNVADLQGTFTTTLYSLVPATVVAAIPTQYSSLGSKSLITSCVSS